jgi:toxoflavin biosynthesis protein ToxC
VTHDLEGGLTRSLGRVESPVLSLCGDTTRVFVGTYGSEVLRLASAPGSPPTAVGRAGAPVPSLCLLKDRLVAGTYNGELIAFDPESLEVFERTQAHGGSIKSLAKVNERVFAAASTDRTASVGTVGERTTVLHHGNLLNAVAYASGFIATASRDRTVRVGRLVEGDGGYAVLDERVLTGADESVKCVGIVADGDRVVVLGGSYDFRVYVWDIDFTGSPEAAAVHRVAHVFRQAASTMCPGRDGEVYIAGWDGQIIRATPVRRDHQLEIAVETVVACCLHDTDAES